MNIWQSKIHRCQAYKNQWTSHVRTIHNMGKVNIASDSNVSRFRVAMQQKKEAARVDALIRFINTSASEVPDSVNPANRNEYLPEKAHEKYHLANEMDTRRKIHRP